MLALWVSIAVHAAIIGLVRVAPRTVVAMDQVLEARLESPAPALPQDLDVPLLLSSNEAPETLISVQEMQPVVFQDLREPKPETKSEPAPELPAPPPPPTHEQAKPNNPDPAKSESGPKLEVPLTVDNQYYTARELDVQPKPMRKIEPVYPAEYESRGAAGYAILEMRVENNGLVSDLKVVEISPSGFEAFGREALVAFSDARFIPARRKGQQVRALFRVKVVFEVNE